MLSPLLPDDDLSALLNETEGRNTHNGTGDSHGTTATAARPAGAIDDAQLLRGLLEDGPPDAEWWQRGFGGEWFRTSLCGRRAGW